MRVLGIDYGSERIGLAVSDPAGVLALPAGHLVRTHRAADLAALRDWATGREIDQIVIGLPLHMDGRPGREAEAVLSFAEELRATTSLPIDTIDERWTSQQAERDLRTVQPKRSRRRKRSAKGEVDTAAATLILRTWLERQHS